MTTVSSKRSIATLVHPTPEPGSGVLRPFPSPALPDLDPFVFLDTGAPLELGSREIYVGPHGHRGVQPVSLVFRARIDHRDSLGNEATVSSGGMQWLSAGSGALHEEVLRGDDAGVFHMAQLWVNVRSDRKMDPPEHRAIGADRVPLITDIAAGVSVRLFAGELAGRIGPAPLGTPVLIAHVRLEAGARIDVPVPSGWNAGVTVVAGRVSLGDASEPDGEGPGATAAFEHDGDAIALASADGGEVLVMAGQPIGESIVMGGGFVMTSSDEIRVAHDDLLSGRFGELEPSR